MRYSMENASMKVEVESLGAELKSVLGKKVTLSTCGAAIRSITNGVHQICFRLLEA